MPLATYKDLCIDAVDAHQLGTFWAATLGLDLERLDDGDVRLVGPTPQHAIWVNTVPEPLTVKQRVHLDVDAASADDVIALGRDPEGGELCVFEREEVAAYRLHQIVVDCRNHRAQAAWWADVLGAEPGHDGHDRWSWVEAIPGTPFRQLFFQPVPEPKTVKNRVHWDVDSGDVPDLVGRGATLLREPDDDVTWTVLADPEGIEFCAFEPR